MMGSFQKQVQVQSLPPFGIYRRPRLKETDLNEIVRMLDGVMREYMCADTVAEVTLSEEDLTIMADTVLLQGALINLVRNSMDAMPYGGTFSLTTGRVDFGDESSLDGFNLVAGPCAFISFADTGTGIDGDNKERIFEPFFTTKTGNGTRPGLPTTYRIVTEHGGSMKAESTQGKGAAVIVYLPLAKPEKANIIPIPLPAPHGRRFWGNGA